MAAVTNSYTSPTISKVGQPRLHAGKSILKGAVPEQRPSTQHTNKVKEMQQAELHAGGVVRPGEAAKLTRPSVQTPAAVLYSSAQLCPNHAAMPGTDPTSTKCELNPATCNDPCNDHACSGSPSVGCKVKLVGGRLCARREALVVSTRAASTVANFAFQTVGRNSSSSCLLRPFCVE